MNWLKVTERENMYPSTRVKKSGGKLTEKTVKAYANVKRLTNAMVEGRPVTGGRTPYKRQTPRITSACMFSFWFSERVYVTASLCSCYVPGISS
jgi:hypothetical protein